MVAVFEDHNLEICYIPFFRGRVLKLFDFLKQKKNAKRTIQWSIGGTSILLINVSLEDFPPNKDSFMCNIQE